MLIQKLKFLKKALIHYNKDRVGSVVDQVDHAREDMYNAQTRLQDDPLNAYYIQEEKSYVRLCKEN